MQAYFTCARIALGVRTFNSGLHGGTGHKPRELSNIRVRYSSARQLRSKLNKIRLDCPSFLVL